MAVEDELCAGALGVQPQPQQAGFDIVVMAVGHKGFYAAELGQYKFRQAGRKVTVSAQRREGFAGGGVGTVTPAVAQVDEEVGVFAEGNCRFQFGNGAVAVGKQGYIHKDTSLFGFDRYSVGSCCIFIIKRRGGDMQQFSERDIEKLRSLIEQMERDYSADPHVRLLTSLEPFLNEEQRRRLPTAIALVRFLKERQDEDGRR